MRLRTAAGPASRPAGGGSGAVLAAGVAVATGLAALSLLWAHTLSYDPWSWAIWGREIVHGSLSTTGGSSWKPLPVLCDTVFSLFEGAAPALWLIVARAGALLALLLAYRLGTRAAGPLAGALAVAWVALSSHAGFGYGWYGFFATGWSEGLLVALVLGALEAQAEGHPRAALVAWTAAALIRPEAILFLILAAVLIGRRHPTARLAAVLVLAVVALWLVPDYLGSGQLLRAGTRARQDVPAAIAHAAVPGLRDLGLMRELIAAPVLAGIALALLLSAGVARRRVLAGLAVAGVWLAVIAVMTQAGFPGVPRFFVVAISLLCLLAGIGWAWALARVQRRWRRWLAAAGVIAVNLAFLAGHVPQLRSQIRGAAYAARLDAQLSTALRRAGGVATVRGCGPVRTNPFEVPVMSWDLGRGARVTDAPVRSGMVFRSAVFAQREALPPAPPARAAFALVTRTGGWTVYARCAPSAGGGRGRSSG